MVGDILLIVFVAIGFYRWFRNGFIVVLFSGRGVAGGWIGVGLEKGHNGRFLLVTVFRIAAFVIAAYNVCNNYAGRNNGDCDLEMTFLDDDAGQVITLYLRRILVVYFLVSRLSGRRMVSQNVAVT